MNTHEIFACAAVLLLALSVVSVAARSLEKTAVFRFCDLWGAAAAALILAAGTGLRWSQYKSAMQTGWLMSFPVTTLYESVVFCGLVLLVLLACWRRQLAQTWVPPLVQFVLGAGILGLSLRAENASLTLFLPSLKSYWLLAHVALSFVGYAFFALAACLSARALWRGDEERARRSVRTMVALGTLFFTVGGILFGAIWAQVSWGRFWGWDPKETWALVTWLVYALILHFDWAGALKGKGYHAAVCAAFLLVVFTFFGVNFLFCGLHGYLAR